MLLLLLLDFPIKNLSMKKQLGKATDDEENSFYLRVVDVAG